jgi:hypothetical protein
MGLMAQCVDLGRQLRLQLFGNDADPGRDLVDLRGNHRTPAGSAFSNDIVRKFLFNSMTASGPNIRLCAAAATPFIDGNGCQYRKLDWTLVLKISCGCIKIPLSLPRDIAQRGSRSVTKMSPRQSLARTQNDRQRNRKNGCDNSAAVGVALCCTCALAMLANRDFCGGGAWPRRARTEVPLEFQGL